VIAAIDHAVLTTRDEAMCLVLYVGVLGMALERYAEDRIGLRCGRQKITVHQPVVMATLAARPRTPGTVDLCFAAAAAPEEVIERLHGIPIVPGPVARTGATQAVYVPDPDDNPIEIAVPAQ
jgi:catechol 2,3-dioxygenase-like lactoylglutathione lyase family enzyme